MKQIIVKRQANIPSKEAIALLSEEYADAEILSFRRVKTAGSNEDYFVATIRMAAEEDIEINEEDVVVEGKEHEEEEDAKLDKIIDMIQELIKKDEEVHKTIEGGEPKKKKPPIAEERPPVENPMPFQAMGSNKKCECWDGYCRVPGTKPCEPGSCEKCDAASKKSMVIVEREANVKKSRAKLELLKEFGKKYKIARLAKTGSVYSATLVKRAEWHGLRGEQEAEINDIFNNEAQLERKRKERIKQQALEAIDRGADYDELDDIFGDEDPLEFF